MNSYKVRSGEDAVQGGSNFKVCGWNPSVWPLKWTLLSSTFIFFIQFILLHKSILTFIKCLYSKPEAYPRLVLNNNLTLASD